MTKKECFVVNTEMNIKTVEIKNTYYKMFQIYGNNPEQNAWKKALIWEKHHQHVLENVKKSYLGFYNPMHDYKGEYRGFVACVFLSIPEANLEAKKVILQRFSGGNYAEVDKNTINDYTKQINFFNWLNKNQYELDVSVHFEKYEFFDGLYSQDMPSKQLFPFIENRKQNGEIIYLPNTVCLAHKCSFQGIDQGVQWYVNRWCMSNKDMPYYTKSRVFVCVKQNVQYCMVLYPPNSILIENNIENLMTIGGKYLRFKCNAMLLRRMIPKYMKQLIHDGYRLDMARFFFEEHFKHCENIKKMMMAYMYFPIY